MTTAHISITFMNTGGRNSRYQEVKTIIGEPNGGFDKNPGVFSKYWKNVNYIHCVNVLSILFHSESISGWAIESED